MEEQIIFTLESLEEIVDTYKDYQEANRKSRDQLLKEYKDSVWTMGLSFKVYARANSKYKLDDILTVKYKTRNRNRYPQVQEFERKVFVKEVTGWNTSTSGGVEPCIVYKLGIVNKDGSKSERNHLGGKHISEDELLKSIVNGTK